jgi:4a-hydroxytetrahydrobiopterin dehydratase
MKRPIETGADRRRPYHATMPTIVTPAALAADARLADWRYLLGRLETTYRCGSFAAAGQLVGAIAAAADAGGHHPDLDVRYPDVVHVALTTHAAGAETTELDVDLATTISALAGAAGATCDAVSAQGLEIAIDALDIDAVRPFWEAVLAYRPLQHRPDGPINLVDPARVGPVVWFQQMDEARTQRNRIHVDVTVAHDVAEQRVAAALAAGGHLVSDDRAPAWWVLADREGNEVCVCTWQDRD